MAHVRAGGVAFSYLGVLYIGVALRGIFLTHRRDGQHALGQMIIINRLNAQHDRGEIGHDEWVDGVGAVLGLGGLETGILHRRGKP